jgi:hypothetical protein
MLQLFSDRQAAAVALRLAVAAHDHTDPGTPIGRLGTAVADWLDRNWPGWRTWRPETDDEWAAHQAQLLLGVQPATPQPRDHWQAPLQAVLDTLATAPWTDRSEDPNLAVERWLGNLDQQLATALADGVPPAVVLTLRDARKHLLPAGTGISG